MQSNKEQKGNQSQTQVICFEVRATALRPRLHHYEGFPLNPQMEFPHRNFTPKGITNGPHKTGVPNSNNLFSTKEEP